MHTHDRKYYRFPQQNKVDLSPPAVMSAISRRRKERGPRGRHLFVHVRSRADAGAGEPGSSWSSPAALTTDGPDDNHGPSSTPPLHLPDILPIDHRHMRHDTISESG